MSDLGVIIYLMLIGAGVAAWAVLTIVGLLMDNAGLHLSIAGLICALAALSVSVGGYLIDRYW